MTVMTSASPPAMSSALANRLSNFCPREALVDTVEGGVQCHAHLAHLVGRVHPDALAQVAGRYLLEDLHRLPQAGGDGPADDRPDADGEAEGAEHQDHDHQPVPRVPGRRRRQP